MPCGLYPRPSRIRKRWGIFTCATDPMGNSCSNSFCHSVLNTETTSSLFNRSRRASIETHWGNANVFGTLARLFVFLSVQLVGYALVTLEILRLDGCFFLVNRGRSFPCNAGCWRRGFGNVRRRAFGRFFLGGRCGCSGELVFQLGQFTRGGKWPEPLDAINLGLLIGEVIQEFRPDVRIEYPSV